MITTELKTLVAEEALNLRQFATENERDRLNFQHLTPRFADCCIYGQMTGCCFSTRANELICLCTQPFSADTDYYEEPRKTFISRGFSPIEFYICQPEARNKELIAYLKGETTDLEL